MISRSRVTTATKSNESANTGTILINAATRNALKLEKKSGFFHINSDVVIGDLYRDPADATVALILVTRKVHLEELEEVVKPETPITPNLSDIKVDDKNI